MHIKTRYQCPVCKDEHEQKAAAEGCCPHEVKTVLVCGECGNSFDWYDTQKAEACCEKEVARRLHLAAVERAKRVCLCGELISAADAHDSKYIGTLPCCRSCILRVAPEMLTPEQIATGRAA